MRTLKNNFHSDIQEITDTLKNPASEKLTSPNSLNWAVLIAEWKKSNLSQKEFCKRHALNFNTFTYQRGKSIKKHEAPLKLLPVKMPNNSLTSSLAPNYFTLQYPNGIKLSIPACADINTLNILLCSLGE